MNEMWLNGQHSYMLSSIFKACNCNCVINITVAVVIFIFLLLSLKELKYIFCSM
jgi:hypothetical protein